MYARVSLGSFEQKPSKPTLWWSGSFETLVYRVGFASYAFDLWGSFRASGERIAMRAFARSPADIRSFIRDGAVARSTGGAPQQPRLFGVFRSPGSNTGLFGRTARPSDSLFAAERLDRLEYS